MENITFWSHPITYLWNEATNILSNRSDKINISADEKILVQGSIKYYIILFVLAVLLFIFIRYSYHKYIKLK